MTEPPAEPNRLRRDLGTVHSYATLVGILVGAGIFKVTSEASAATGPSVVLGYLVLAPVVLAAAVPYAVFQSTRLALGPGGDYAHIRAVFGSGVATFLAGWLKVISYLGALAFLALAFADYFLRWLELSGLGTVDEAIRPWAATGVLVGFWSIHSVGVRWFGRVQVAMCAILGASILVLVLPGLTAIESENYRPFFSHGGSGFLAALPPLFFAYAGFESLCHTAGEVRDAPTRLPRIYLRGVALTTLIFVAMAAVAFGAMDAGAMANSTAVMADAASRFLPTGGAWIVALGGVMATATSVNATMAVPPRLALTMVEDNHLPASLGNVHRTNGTPRTGLAWSLVISLALLWSGQIGLALNIAVLSLLVVYWLHSIAMLRMGPALRAEVTADLSPGLARAAAWIAVVSLGLLIGTLVYGDLKTLTDRGFFERIGSLELTAIELFVAWSLLGLLVRRMSHRQPVG